MLFRVATVAAVLAVSGGCGRAAPPPRTNDAVAGRGGKVEARVDAKISDDDVKKLLADASLCGTQPSCPPREELERRVAGPGGEQVVRVALDAMAAPTSRSDQGPGKYAQAMIGGWLDAQQRAGTLDARGKQLVADGLKRVVATGSPFLRMAAFNLFVDHDLPGASALLAGEIEGGRRDFDETFAAGRALGPFQKDYSLILRWLGSDDAKRWCGALGALKGLPDPPGGSAPLRQALYRLGMDPRIDKLGFLADELLFWYEIFLDDKKDDRELVPAIFRLAKHPEANTQAHALQLIDSHHLTPPR